MSEKRQLKEEDLSKVNGGWTWEEELEASRNNLPEGDVTCKFCGHTFNAKENAAGFMNETNEQGMTTTYPIAKCPNCGLFWSR